MKCDTCLHQCVKDNNLPGISFDWYCAKGHWYNLEERDKFDAESIEVWEDPYIDCKDYESEQVTVFREVKALELKGNRNHNYKYKL